MLTREQQALYARINKATNIYELFDVKQDADLDAITQSFRAIRDEIYHDQDAPDPALRSAAASAMESIGEAFSTYLTRNVD